MKISCAVVAVALAGCGIELGPPSPWIEFFDEGDALAPSSDLVPPTSAEDGPTLRVASYNVLHGADPVSIARRLRADPALATVDVLLLQEIEAHDAEFRLRAEAMADALQMAYVYAPSRLLPEGGTHGLAILSTLPLSRPRVMELPHADVGIRPRRRIALAVQGTWHGTEFTFVNVHLDTRTNAGVRILQLDPAVRDHQGVVIIGGDMNDNGLTWTGSVVPNIPASTADEVHVVDDYFRAMGYRTPTAGVGPTQDSLVRKLRLDGLYTRGLQVHRAGVADVTGSDHVPVWIDVSLD